MQVRNRSHPCGHRHLQQAAGQRAMANNSATRMATLMLYERLAAAATCVMYPKNSSIGNIPEYQHIVKNEAASRRTDSAIIHSIQEHDVEGSIESDVEHTILRHGGAFMKARNWHYCERTVAIT
eukprot:594396-Pyramimonas_sp.AAC.1